MAVPGSVLGILLFVFHLTNAQQKQINTACTSSMISTFTPCLNYVTRSSATGSSPTQDCCGAVKSLMTDGMDCMCLIVTGNIPVSIPFVNRNLAISLPRMCRTSVPVQCKAAGDQLPAPGPALFGPSPAPGASAPTRPGPEGVEAESPTNNEGSDLSPTSSEPPPEVWIGPSQNPGVRPVINSNASTPTQVAALFPKLVLTFVIGIIVSNFL